MKILLRSASLIGLCLIMSTASHGCHDEYPQANSKSAIRLQFERKSGKHLLGSFLEVAVDFNECAFSKVKQIQYRPDANGLGLIKAVKDAVVGCDHVAKILDVSPNKEWASALCSFKPEKPFEEYPDLTDGYIYLVNLSNTIAARRMEYSTSLCFSADSQYGIFDDVLELKRIRLDFLNDTNILFSAHKFIMLPDRERILVLHDYKIYLIDLNGKLLQHVGEYTQIAYEAGTINNEWGYVLTRWEPKNPRGNLFFINLNTFTVIKYPYELDCCTLIRVIWNNHSRG